MSRTRDMAMASATSVLGIVGLHQRQKVSVGLEFLGLGSHVQEGQVKIKRLWQRVDPDIALCVYALILVGVAWATGLITF